MISNNPQIQQQTLAVSAQFPPSVILNIHKDGVNLVKQYFKGGGAIDFLDDTYDISRKTATEIALKVTSLANGEINDNPQQLIECLRQYRGSIEAYLENVSDRKQMGLTVRISNILKNTIDTINFIEESKALQPGSEKVESHNPTETNAVFYKLNEVIKKADQKKIDSDIQNKPPKIEYPTYQIIKTLKYELSHVKLGEFHTGSRKTADWPFTGVRKIHDQFSPFVKRVLLPGEGKEKLHISVHPKHMQAAYDCIAPLLFSKHCPVIAFKFSRLDDMDKYYKEKKLKIPEFRRLYNGAQITLYWYENTAKGVKTIEEQRKDFAEFTLLLEKTLEKNDISKGDIPKSDVPLGEYISFRNEKYNRQIDITNEIDQFLVAKMRMNSPLCQAIELAIDGAIIPPISKSMVMNLADSSVQLNFN